MLRHLDHGSSPVSSVDSCSASKVWVQQDRSFWPVSGVQTVPSQLGLIPSVVAFSQGWEADDNTPRSSKIKRVYAWTNPTQPNPTQREYS